MTTSTTIFLSENAKNTMVLWINRGLESLWLLAIVLIPVAFVDRDYLLSEAVISYVEVPKIALLRTLAALMAVLWLLEWGIRGRFDPTSFRPLSVTQFLAGLQLYLGSLKSKLIQWLRADGTHWLFLAVWFFLGTTLLSTVLSGSFNVSMWGEVPGQDGYPAYTIVAYILVFGVIATHLKTRPQLWRLLGALAFMGVLVSGYAIFQHYGRDFLNLTEITGGGEQRVTSFMGNAIFSAAVMMMTIPITLAAASLSLRIPAPASGSIWMRVRPWAVALGLATFWGIVLTVQLLGLTFTFSMGPWLGAVVAIGAFLGLAAVFVGWRHFLRAALLIGITIFFWLALLQALGSVSILGTGREISLLFVAAGLASGASLLALIGFLERANFSLSGILLQRISYLAQRPILALSAIVITLAVIAALFVALLPSSIGNNSKETNSDSDIQASPTAGDSTTAQVAARLNLIGSRVLNGFGGRGETWKGSLRLIRDRPWFDFDNLSLGWFRPVIGYGPDLFRYTYLLESPPLGRDLLPEEPDHAHNFFLHQTVEQGYLGLLSVLAVVGAVAGVGGYYLLQRRHEFSTAHTLMVVVLLAVLAGKLVEMIFGVARVSDLTVLWVLLGVFAALPRVMRPPDSSIEPEPAALPRTARRRNRAQAGPEVRAGLVNLGILTRLAIVALVVGGVFTLTWVKSVNNVRAAESAGDALASFQKGDYQTTLASLDRAIDLAPDVSLYHNHRAAVYLAYQRNKSVAPERGCSSQEELPYDVCLAVNSLQSNLEGNDRRPFYYRSRLALAGSAYNLPQLSEETVEIYQRVKALVPRSWPIRNELADAYLVAGRPEEALQELSDSLAITKDSFRSAGAHYLQGLAYQELGDLENAAPAFERALELQPNNDPGPKARARLPQVYLGMDRFDLAGDAFFRLGKAQRKNGQLNDAANTYGQSADAYRSAGMPSPEANSLYTQGEIYGELGERNRATSSFTRAVELDDFNPLAPAAYRFLAGTASRSGDVESTGLYWKLGADAHLKLGNLKEAASFLTQALQEDYSASLISEIYQTFATIRQELGELEAAPHQLFQAAAAAADAGNLEKSAALYLESAESFGKVGLPGRAGRSYYLGALAARDTGQPGDAAAAAQRSGALYEDLGQKSLAADSYFLAGEMFLALAKVSESAQAMERSLELNPDHDSASLAPQILASLYEQLNERRKEAESLFRQGVYFLEAGQVEEAVEVLEKSMAVDNSANSARRAHEVLAEAYLRLQRPDLAAQSLFQLGVTYRELDEFPEAALAIERSLELDPSSAAASRARPILAEIYQTLGQPEQVAAAYFRSGEAYRDLGESEKAATSFQRSAEAYAALGQSGKEALSFYHLASSYLQLGRSRDSVDSFERSILLDSSASFAQVARQNLPELYLQLEELSLAAEHLYRLGVDLYENGQWALAARDISRSLELDSSGSNVVQAYEYLVNAFTKLNLPGEIMISLFILARSYQDAGELAKSVESYERVVSLPVATTTAIKAYLKLGELYKLLGSRELEAGALFNLGRGYYETKSWEDSIRPLERSTEIYLELGLSEQAANAIFHAALSISTIGQLERAAEYLERSLELDSSSERALSFISTLASFYKTLGRFDIAAETYFEAALMSLEHDDESRAVSLFRSSLGVISNGPRSPLAHRYLAEIYESRGDLAQAARHRLLAAQ